jgi:hypothetical protein
MSLVTLVFVETAKLVEAKKNLWHCDLVNSEVPSNLSDFGHTPIVGEPARRYRDLTGDTQMKTILTTVIALLAISDVALAARSQDLRDTDTYCGKFMAPFVPGRICLNNTGTDAAPLRVIDMPYVIQGKDFDREQRRLDEKNGS